METRLPLTEVEKIISDVARTQFADVIESVRVEEATDSDGLPIYRIIIVWEGDVLDPHKASGFVRHIRPKLREREQFWFPHVRFVSKADAQKLAAA